MDLREPEDLKKNYDSKGSALAFYWNQISCVCVYKTITGTTVDFLYDHSNTF